LLEKTPLALVGWLIKSKPIIAAHGVAPVYFVCHRKTTICCMATDEKSAEDVSSQRTLMSQARNSLQSVALYW
jgi:hypothetical protein